MSAWLSALPALWQQIQWRWPWAALLAAVPLLFVYAHRFARQRTLSYADPQLWPWAVGTLRLPRSQAARLWFEAIGWMLLALALAGPRWPALQDSPDGRVSQSRQGAHIVVIVQISDSMQANDVAPNRLTRARLALQDSLQRLRGERLSLIAYGATAGVLLPATHDRGLFAQALQWLDGDLLPTSGSNLGHALALALEQIRRAGSRQNAVLLITDADPESLQGKGGEEVQGAVDAMRAQEAPLYAWFAMPHPSLLPGEGMRPASGGTDQAFDVDPYRRLINMTGGGTAFLADSGFGWNVIYTRGIGARPALSGAVQQAQGWEELYVWPLSLGLLLLGCAYTRWPGKLRRISFARASASGRARLLMAWFMAVGLLFAFYWPSDASAQAMRGDTERKAWQAYNSKQWALARQLYAQVGGFRGHWGAGLSALNAGRAADAVEQLGLAWMFAPDPDKRLDALYNLAHAYAALGRWDIAAEAWRTVLDRRPGDARAATNLKVALAELQRQSLAARKAQDLYGRFGKMTEGVIQPDGGREPTDEPDSPAAGSGAAADANQGKPLQAAQEKRPAFIPSKNQLLSGQGKIEQLAEQKTALQKALIQQDAAAPLPPSTGGTATAKGSLR